jgi:hypothetical protein
MTLKCKNSWSNTMQEFMLQHGLLAAYLELNLVANLSCEIL